MTFTGILKKFSVIIVALLALGLTRMGIGYLTILLAIGIIMPIICDNKKSAIFTGILYATLGYLLSYPSSLFLINYMPDRDIPISVSSTSILTHIFLGDMENGISFLESIGEKNDLPKTYHMLLSEVYSKTGQTEKATEILEKFCAENKNISDKEISNVVKKYSYKRK